MTTTAYLALGANLGDRLWGLRQAVAMLEAAGVRVVGRSPVFETVAVADEPQPDYLNAVIRVETERDARGLLTLGLEIERRLGRERPAGRSGAARTIDIDLLLFGDAVIGEADLRVPHPRLLERAFVRAPLAAVAQKDLRHPVSGDSLDRFAATSDVRLWPEEL